MSLRKIRKNDIVTVLSGAHQGKTGKVLQVFPSSSRAIVEGVNLVRKHLRKTQERPQGGVADKEAPMALSKLMIHCPACKKAVRISRAVEAGARIRKCKKCGHSFDV